MKLKKLLKEIFNKEINLKFKLIINIVKISLEMKIQKVDVNTLTLITNTFKKK